MFDSASEPWGGGIDLPQSAPSLRPWYAPRPARSGRVARRCDCTDQCALRALAAAGPLLWTGTHANGHAVSKDRTWLSGQMYTLEASIDSDAVLECLRWRTETGALVAAHALASTDWRGLDRLAAAGPAEGSSLRPPRMRWAGLATISARGELQRLGPQCLSGLDVELLVAWLRHYGLDHTWPRAAPA